ncbi:MAG: Mur ligase family protein [bacterium]|nr:Mur ligase family protein [bacterium]
MNIRSQLYLLQLEDYDLNRFKRWLSENPSREILEKKGKINWTLKARTLYFLAKTTGSMSMAVKLLTPFDSLIKLLFILLSKIKLLFFHRKMITIGVTGSWGKTTTKEKLAAVLGVKYSVYKTAGNNNTLLGVAKNVLKIPLKTEIFICEMGAYKTGDIKTICHLVGPKIGIITAVGPMHLERFGTLEKIRQTKYELFESVPVDGLKIGPGEDAIFKTAAYFQIRPNEVEETLSSFSSPPHRLEVKFVNGLTIIDDCYNSNPEGFRMALKKLKEIKGSPKILFTPGMIELGELQFSENKKAAEEAARVCDHIIIVGETNKKALLTGLEDFRNASWVADLEEARKLLTSLARPSAAILFENDLPDHYF